MLLKQVLQVFFKLFWLHGRWFSFISAQVYRLRVIDISDLVDILRQVLEVRLVKDVESELFGFFLADAVDESFQHHVSVVIEEGLEQLVLVVNVVYLDHQRLHFR